MGGLTTLLESARAAGLTIRADGERLTVRGPKSAEMLAKSILAQKVAVIAWLLAGAKTCHESSSTPTSTQSCASESVPATPTMSVERCYCCGQRRWWRSIYGPHLICAVCHPPSFSSVVAERIGGDMSNKLQTTEPN